MGTAALLLAIVVGLIWGWPGFGHRVVGERAQRVAASPQFRGRSFRNPQPLRNSYWGMVRESFRKSPHTSPATPPVPDRPGPQIWATPPVTGLRVTWLGHSTTLVEVDGLRVLTDPVWSDQVGPMAGVGPRRFFPPPIALADLPAIDVVVISHDHFDHLDMATMRAMRGWKTRFVVPLGVGAHLEYWGIPPSQIVELDWWGQVQVGALSVVCTPARHASGRMLIDDDAKLWAGWALLGPHHRVYYSGDTGLFPAMREIGARLGPFDLTMIEVGQYGSAWPDWHIGPEQAITAHGWVRGRVLLPVHWGAFALAFHGWTEPIERALVAGQVARATLVTPRPGQPIEPLVPSPQERWWPAVPWKTGAQDPIVSSQIE